MRTIKELFSPIGLSHIKLIPSIILKIKNWPEYLINYITNKQSGGPYTLRNGYKIICQDFDDLGTLSEVAFKKCYGNQFPMSGTIIDIGANTGISAIFIASESGNSRVFAYEPFEKNYTQILKQIAINKLENRVFAYKLGVDKSIGQKRLYITNQSVTPNLYNITDSGESIDIETTTIDKIIEDHKLDTIDFIKMDCEGAEFDILYGTSEDNIQRIKRIKMEYHNIFNNDDKRNSVYLRSWLEQKGFIITKQRTQPNAEHCGFIWCEKVD